MALLVRRAVIGLLIVALQWLAFGRLTIWGAYPDVVLLYVAWLGLREGRLVGSVGGWILGFLLDAVYGTWGLHMLTKTIVGFLVGLFPTEDRETFRISPVQAFAASVAIALLHNGLFVLFLVLQSGARTTFMITTLWLGSSLYTGFVGTLASLFAKQ